jgi:hypothetical protein
MEYEVTGFPDIGKRMLFPVIYDSSLFDCTKYYAKAIADQQRFNNIYATLQALYKSPDWSYEKEWRLVFIAGVVREEMNYFIGRPKAVYLGAKMSDSDRAKVLAVCKARGIETRAMKLVPNRFQLASNTI